MSARKLLMVCVLAVAAILPLVGCGDKAAKAPSGGSGSGTSNTTTGD